jgi:hypothetical protein
MKNESSKQAPKKALRKTDVSSSVCLHRFYHVKNNGYVYCTDCNKKLGSQTDC